MKSIMICKSRSLSVENSHFLTAGVDTSPIEMKFRGLSIQIVSITTLVCSFQGHCALSFGKLFFYLEVRMCI